MYKASTKRNLAYTRVSLVTHFILHISPRLSQLFRASIGYTFSCAKPVSITFSCVCHRLAVARFRAFNTD